MPLPDGYYTITITDENYPDLIYSLNVLVSDHGTSDRIRLVTDFSEALVVAITDAFPEFIRNKRYREYLEGMPDYPNPVYEYCLIDINQDGVNEMILSIYESTMPEVAEYLVFAQNAGEITKVDEFTACYGIRYSAVYKAIVYTDTRPSLYSSGYSFSTFDGEKMNWAFSCCHEGDIESSYYLNTGEQKEISESEYQMYMSELVEITDWTEISDDAA